MRKQSTLFAGMALAALVMIGLTATADRSSASFTAQVSVAGNSFTTGTLTATRTGAGAIVSLADMVPGDSKVASIQINNTGTLPFQLNASVSATACSINGSATACAAVPLWSDATNALDVLIKDSANNTLYNGKLNSMAAWTTAAHLNGSSTTAPYYDALKPSSDTYTFTFSLPAAAGNTFQANSATFTVNFDASQYPGGVR
ncbi:MAG TPA: TasA family protein [Candidatus Limnocylindria bacterium]|jgi:hypothetical protein|nr:TasA family protein [Candidatus Limnocylindria bacterium]